MAVASERPIEVTDGETPASVANPRRTRVDAQGRPTTAQKAEVER